jgi:LysM repeat protein
VIGAVLAASLAWGAEHVIRGDDTLQSIAAAWSTDVPTLQRLNGLVGASLPAPGAVLLVPDRPGSASVPAVLASVTGTLDATDPSGKPVVAQIGAALAPGSVVCTGADSYATVRLAATRAGGHDDVSLDASTCLKVVASTGAAAGRQSRLDLRSGSVSVRAGDSPGEVTVATPGGLATGAQGGFRVHVEPSRKTRLEAIGGAVAAIGAGREVLVAKGFGTRVAEGRAPEAPVRLPEPGQPSYPDDGTALLDPVFAWTPAERALGYRLEFSSAPDFSELVAAEDVPKAAYTPELLFLPFRVRGLWWRVASFDRAGFLGPPSEPRSLTFPAGVGP